MRQDTILEENTITWIVLHRMKTTRAIKCISGAFQLLKKPVLSDKEGSQSSSTDNHSNIEFTFRDSILETDIIANKKD